MTAGVRLVGLAKAMALSPRSLRLRRAALGADGTITYVGEGESLPWLARLHGGMRGTGDRVSLPALAGAVGAARARGAVVVELDRLLTALAPRGGRTALTWVRQEILLSPGRRLPGTVEAVYGRAVRREGFTPRTTRKPGTVQEFHRRFYRPYVTARFGAEAHLRCPGELHWAVRRGFLLQVMDGERWVSGAVCRLRGRTVQVLAYGLSGDVERELRRGALAAVNYLLIAWAREHGMDRIDLLRSRAHLDDGVFEHKRRLGAVARPDPWPHTRLLLYPSERGAWPGRFGAHLAPAGGAVVPVGPPGED